MFSLERKLVLTPLAKSDFAEIVQYTLETWGEAKALSYGSVLNKAMELLRQNPSLGHKCASLSDEHRVFPVGHHIAVYSARDTTVVVFRLLHERMDIIQHV